MAIIVDAHCDTLSALGEQKLSQNGGHLDIERMQKGGVTVQFFAVFISPEHKGRELELALEQIDTFYRELEDAPTVKPVCSVRRLENCIQEGMQAAVLAVEGGEVLCGNIAVLRVLYRLGVRCLTLTWNNRNRLADGVGETGSNGGLTDFGRQVVREMNKLGMLIDVSHLSERGFWDVLEVSEKPVIASHSNARAVCNHPRNLTDSQIKALAGKGGVMGITFVPQFVDPGNPSLSRLLDHVDHIVHLAGTDCLGFGSDFDGIDKTILGLEDVSKYPSLYRGLLNRGYCDEDVEKLLGKNFLRVINRVWN